MGVRNKDVKDICKGVWFLVVFELYEGGSDEWLNMVELEECRSL